MVLVRLLSTRIGTRFQLNMEPMNGLMGALRDVAVSLTRLPRLPLTP
jgi:hypothetical protein